MSKIFKRYQFAPLSTALLLAVLINLIALLSVSPELHKWFHADADAAEHSCAVTLFAKGQIDATTIAPVMAGWLMLFGVIVLLSEAIQFPLANYRFSLGRAPPASASHLS
jgi:hypothetical protein